MFMLSGCAVVEGDAVYLVTAVGRASEWGKILAELDVERPNTPLQVGRRRRAGPRAQAVPGVGAMASPPAARALPESTAQWPCHRIEPRDPPSPSRRRILLRGFFEWPVPEVCGRPGRREGWGGGGFGRAGPDSK